MSDAEPITQNTRITTTMGTLLSAIATTAVAVSLYFNSKGKIDKVKDQQDVDRGLVMALQKEVGDVKGQLTSVLAQLTTISVDLRVNNTVSAMRMSDAWNAQMMSEYSLQSKDAMKNVQGVAWAEWPNVRSIQSALGPREK